MRCFTLWGAFITQSNITQYSVQHCVDWSKYDTGSNHKLHPLPSSNRVLTAPHVLVCQMRYVPHLMGGFGVVHVESITLFIGFNCAGLVFRGILFFCYEILDMGFNNRYFYIVQTVCEFQRIVEFFRQIASNITGLPTFPLVVTEEAFQRNQSITAVLETIFINRACVCIATLRIYNANICYTR